jgi:3-hydroxyisobutyrate dehydrogenase-like beta-hydroxyacid dehydrogenase
MNPITAEKSELGFVGVGYMGRPIAQRLLAPGFKLIALERAARSCVTTTGNTAGKEMRTVE